MHIPRQFAIKLDSWLAAPDRKPIILRGARQVGKSSTIRNWGEQKFGKLRFLEINLEANADIRKIFEKDPSAERIVRELQFVTGKDITHPPFLLFIDEAQASPNALVSLRYFHEHFPQLHVIAAGSLLDFVLEKISFPVGRVDTLILHPLTFWEYLNAIGKGHYLDSILSQGIFEEIPEPVHLDLLFELKRYFRIGGMPEAVSKFVSTDSFAKVAEVQERLVIAYRLDFSKYAKEADWDLLLEVYQRVPFIVGDTRIKYSRLDPHSRTYKVKKALTLLDMAGLIHRVTHSHASQLPLMLGADPSISKLLLLDIGLLQSMLGFRWGEIPIDSDLTKIADGTLAEQFVGQELIAARSRHERYPLHYWIRHKKGSDAEIDFLIEHDGKVVPLEVKSGHRGTLKSLDMYMKNANSHLGFVASQLPSSTRGNIRWIPMYLAGLLK